jgi:hypothetical protein
MSDVDRAADSLRRIEDLLMRIEDLRAEAQRRGYGPLAQSLNLARIEAQSQYENAAQHSIEPDADPTDLGPPDV